MGIDIWSKGEVFKYLKFLLGKGQIRSCTKLKLRKGHCDAYYAECVEDWNSRDPANNVDGIDITAYHGPSSYYWPICPKDCPGFVETKDFTNSLFADRNLKLVRKHTHTFEFDFSISVAGEDRDLAKRLAQMLTEANAIVFYDEHYRSRLLGKKLRLEFQEFYGPSTHFFVPLVSKHYVSKYWPRYELDIARKEAKKREKEFILPLALDDSRLPGLDDDISYLDLRGIILEKVVEILLDKLPAKPVATTKKVWVSTFGLVVTEVLESGDLPPSTPREYIYLCDWLEQDLRARLDKAPIRHFAYTEPSSRDGECLSVRIAFEWSPTNQPLDFGDLGWWQVLEVGPFEDFYPYQDPNKILAPNPRPPTP